ICQIHQCPTCPIDHAHDACLLKEKRCSLAKHLSLFRQLREIDGDGSDLSTRDSKAGAILRYTHTTFHPASTRLGEMACYPRHIRIVEGADTNFIVRAQDAECRRDTANILCLEMLAGTAEHHDEDHPDPPAFVHSLTSPMSTEIPFWGLP